MEYLLGLKPGALLRHGTYRIERVLGQGGFGITYLATDLNLDRLVAVKEFFPKDYCDRDNTTSHVTLGTQSAKEFVNRLKAKFLKEARNIAKFDHPGIIRIHAAFEENNTAYYVMDYIEGESLSQLVKRRGPLDLVCALSYIKKIGKALEYVHAQKINHLDIKPANIVVRRCDDNPILIDFGLSKQYDSTGNQTSTTPTGISHGYAPMEQYNTGGVREFSPQTDLYSLAATLYFILSGVTPPQATKLIEDELTFPASIPVNLIGPISKAMSPMRRKRHENVSQFISDITDEEDIYPNEDTMVVMPVFASETQIHSDSQNQQPEEPEFNDSAPQKTKHLIYIAIAVVVAIIVVVIIAMSNGNYNDKAKPKTEEMVMPEKVTDMYWESPLGIASYSGEIKIDSISGLKVPNGKGVARITSGEYKGNIYDGEFIDGIMQGKATYILSNGDSFKGQYKNNKYDTGRYTIKSTGEYFEGTFQNGSPDKGTWHDSSLNNNTN